MPSPKPIKGVTERPDAFVGGFKDRRITFATATKYNVNSNGQLDYIPYYNKAGNIQGQKVRNVEKKMWFEGG